MTPPTHRPSTPAIEGRVIRRDGSPLAEVPVAILSSDVGHIDLAAISGADGSFAFDQLDPGRYVLAAQTDAGRSDPETVLVNDGGASFVTLTVRDPAAGVGTDGDSYVK